MFCNLCHMGGSNKIIEKIWQFLLFELHEFFFSRYTNDFIRNLKRTQKLQFNH